MRSTADEGADAAKIGCGCWFRPEVMHKAHIRPDDGFTDGSGIRCIVLATLG